jgi:formate hydrogenlyase subunit 3/multisubunit Na+/H+ antiporter MnhD subunit
MRGKAVNMMKTVNASTAVLIVAACVAVLIGLVILLGPQVLLKGEFEGSTGLRWKNFRETDPEISKYMIAQSLEIGALVLTLGVTALWVTAAVYRKRDRRAWYLLLVSHTLGWGGVAWSNVLTGNTKVVVLGLAFLALAYVGLALGAKEILKQKRP